MSSRLAFTYSHITGFCLAAFAQVLFVSNPALAEEAPSQSVYRVANETTAAQPATTETGSATTAAVPASQSSAHTALDFAQKSGEHPLAPLLRALKISEAEIDRNIHDYSCTFAKRERVDGELGDYQIILLKVMQQPFSVYMRFQQPYSGREVVYVAGQNDGKLIALDAGITRYL
ncbi:MAG TPA: DUF1571 domain-containing protein, partial [Lacipirellulaceae bacterium]|nr:DUF1571 domain-containing protein [Lacipirellulaceae bacterium]